MGSNSNERIQKKLKHKNKQLNEEKITKITNEKEREKNQQGKKTVQRQMINKVIHYPPTPSSPGFLY